MHRLACGSNYN